MDPLSPVGKNPVEPSEAHQSKHTLRESLGGGLNTASIPGYTSVCAARNHHYNTLTLSGWGLMFLITCSG